VAANFQVGGGGPPIDVSFERACVGPAVFTDIIGELQRTSSTHLEVVVRLTNRHPTRKVNFDSWLLRSRGVSLRDDLEGTSLQPFLRVGTLNS
jgi:hypothetical protein